MDFRTALARQKPPRQLGPVRLSYADSCLVLDVAQPARRRAAAQALGGCALVLGLGALGLLLETATAPDGVAAGLVLAAAACVAGAAWLERAPGFHRWALLFASEELVLERSGLPLQPACAERMHFDQVRGLSLRPGPGGARQLVLRYEAPEGGQREAVLLRGLRAPDDAWCAELVSRLEQMLGLTEAAMRPGPPPPIRTSAPGDPPAPG